MEKTISTASINHDYIRERRSRRKLRFLRNRRPILTQMIRLSAQNTNNLFANQFFNGSTFR